MGFTLHLPFVELNPASLIPSVRKLSQERLLRALEFGEALGAKVGVLHTGLIPVRHPVAERLAWEALEETLALLRDPPIPVALENLALWEQDLVRGPRNSAAFWSATPTSGSAWTWGTPWWSSGPRGLSATSDPGGPASPPPPPRQPRAAGRPPPRGLGARPLGGACPFLRGFSGTAALEVVGGPEGVRRSVERLAALLAP